MKLTKRLYCISALILVTGMLYSASLDLETEYRFKGISYRNPDYNTGTKDNESFYANRLRILINGSPIENIRIVTRIQALGLAGGTTEYSIIGGTTTTRYPNTEFEPWIENAYIQLEKINQSNFSLILGKQPFYYGQGLIMADDQLGFNAIKMIWAPQPTFSIEAYTAKINENRFGDNDLDAYGIITQSKKTQSLWMIGLYSERDRTGTFINSSATSFIQKHFLEYYSRKDLKGGFYSINVAVQRGEIDYINPLLHDQKYEGDSNFKVQDIFDYLEPYGFLLQGGLNSPGNTITGPVQVHAAWGLGTGDDAGSLLENEQFLPTLGHRYDGLERTGFGRFYSATLYDTYGGLPAGYSGVQIITLGGTMSPYARMKIGIDYFLFDSQQTAPGGSKQLGRELDFTFRYPFSTYVTFNASYALFFPQDGLGKDSAKAEHLTLGITGQF
ncbi:MAG: hypothetical protein GF384_07360 [Elusimicrobia bacterium]|nr:hypothetical protein [Elusimicrobiota bacterium]MBD3412474.1 hypothetical protein [Elusimicrobiota bacterium]